MRHPWMALGLLTVSILVDKSENLLYLKENGRVLKAYTVSTGKNNSTPVGIFKVTTKLENPAWYKEPGVMIEPFDKRNELGSRWIGLNKKSYGIHGTREPEKLGRQVSHGCVRMKNSDVEELFNQVRPGTEVAIRN